MEAACGMESAAKCHVLTQLTKLSSGGGLHSSLRSITYNQRTIQMHSKETDPNKKMKQNKQIKKKNL